MKLFNFMLRRTPVLAAMCALGASGVATGASAQDGAVLVSTAWLAEHAGDAGLRILHVGMAMRGMPEEVIPGAGFLDYHDFALERNDAGLSIEIPPVEQLAAALGKAGVSNRSRVVLYGSGSAHVVARIYMTLDYLGMGNRTSVLDGGMETWKAEGRPIARELSSYPAGEFVPRVNRDVLVTADWIAERLDDATVTLIDARPENEYTGERSGEGLRPGHIPGAYNLYWADLQISPEQPVLRSLDEVQARWDAAGADRQGVVVSYCYIGMRASYTYMISKHLGYDARFYDGSWNEWGTREDLPAVPGTKRR